MSDKRLIDANELPMHKVKIVHAFGIVEGSVVFPGDIAKAPTIEAEPVRHLTEKELEVAEVLSDLLASGKLNKQEIEAVCYARHQTACKHSKVGLYSCSVETRYGWCCDTCLQDELMRLKIDHNIMTIGSCCGHGRKRPFIQVHAAFVDKMLALGYVQIPLDEHGNGKWCFEPKTFLRCYELNNCGAKMDGGAEN